MARRTDRLPLVDGGSVDARDVALPAVPKPDDTDRTRLQRRIARVLDGARAAEFLSELDAMLTRYERSKS